MNPWEDELSFEWVHFNRDFFFWGEINGKEYEIRGEMGNKLRLLLLKLLN